MPEHHSNNPEQRTTPTVAEPPPRQRGFALLIVLWAVVFLAFLVTQLTAAGRLETHIASNLRVAAVAEAAADGALYASRKEPGEAEWVKALLVRRPARLASVALANKMARIIWALLVRGDTDLLPDTGPYGRYRGRR